MKKRYLVEIEIDESRQPFNGELWQRVTEADDLVYEIDVISFTQKEQPAIAASRPVFGFLQSSEAHSLFDH